VATSPMTAFSFWRRLLVLPAWQKQFQIVLSVTGLHAFAMHQMASSSAMAWSCFFSMHSIILHNMSLW
jgi:hypothetical protein